MKRLLQILTLLSGFAIPCAGQVTKVSQVPTTNTVNQPDLVLIDSTNGSGGYGTRTITVSNLFKGAIGTPVGVASGGTGATTARSAGTNIGIVQMGYFNGVLQDMSNSSAAFAQQQGVSFGTPLNPFLWWSEQAGTGTNAWGVPVTFPGGIATIGNPFFTDLPLTLGTQNFQFFLNNGPTGASLTNVYNGTALSDSLWFFNGVNGHSDAMLTVPMYGTNSVFGGLVGMDAQGTNVYKQEPFGIQVGTVPDADPAGIANLAGSYDIIGSGPFPFYISWNAAFPTGGPWQIPLMSFDMSNYLSSTANPLPVGFPLMTFANSNGVRDPHFNYAFMINENPLSTGALGAGAGVYETNGSMFVSNFLGGGYVRAPSGSTYYNGTGTFQWGEQSGVGDHNANFQVDVPGVFNADGSAWSFDAGGSERIGFVKVNGQFPMAAAAAGAPYQIAHSSATALQNGGSPSTQTLTADLYLDGHTVLVTNNEPLTAQGGIIPITATLNLNSTTTVYSNTFGFAVHNVVAFLKCNTNDANTGYVVGDMVPVATLGNNLSVAGPVSTFWNGAGGYAAFTQAPIGSEANYTIAKRLGGNDAHPSSFANFTLVIAAQ